ncbi:MAG: S-layer homology domain-containing protein [Clostridia bacterium]|nr:S-layer homology domain-containing protein [Clostridia bacterium]
MKKLLASLLAVVMIAAAFAAVVPASAADPVFSDVNKSMWSYDSIVYAVKSGYMQGVGGGKFNPKGSLTRAMVVTALWRREGSPAPKAASGFDDVRAGAWYADAVAWAKEGGVVNGVSDKKFGPEGLITREQLGTMLFRFSSDSLVSVPERADLSSFSDGGKVSGWADDAMQWAVEAGLIKGTTGNLLAPGGKATREQFAAIIERFDNTFKLKYNEPVLRSTYTEPEYPLVGDADFYVATDGDDSADGSFDHPFKTWQRAIEAVRDLKTRKTEGDIKVAFFAGDYGPISVVLTAEDSGSVSQRIIYCAYGDGDVVFNDGLDVAENEFTSLTAEEKTLFRSTAVDKIKKVDLSGRLTKYDPRTCLILGDGGEMTLARYPNKYDDGTDNLMKKNGFIPDANHFQFKSGHLKKRIDNYYHTTDCMLIYGYITTGWYKDLLTTADYDKETGICTIPYPNQARMGQLRYLELDGFDSAEWNQMAIVNVSEELDHAGEYWIDESTRVFYVFEPSGEYHFTGGGDTMLTMSGTEYVTLLGLDFRNSDGPVMWAVGHPRGLTVDRCGFSGCSTGTMVFIEGDPGGIPLDVTVTGCEFSVCAGIALRIESDFNWEDRFTSGTNVVVDNNYFTLTCLRDGCNGALRIAAPFAKVSHNHFYKNYWEDIDFRNAANLTAEYNVFESSCYNGDDTGAMQTFRQMSDSEGSVVRYNLFLNIRGGSNGRYCLYLDGSWGCEVCNNIFYNVDLGVMNNGVPKRNFIHDNIVVNPQSKLAAIATVHAEGIDLINYALENGEPDSITEDWCYTNWQSALRNYDAHPEYKAKVAELWPGLLDITCDLDRINEPEFCLNSTVTIRDNAEINIEGAVKEHDAVAAQYCDITPDTGYTLDQNPFFVNPTIGDYRMKDGAEFANIPYDLIGRY